MRGAHEITWFALVASLLAGLNGLAPDSEGSPMAPGFALMMFGLAAVLGIVIAADHRHRHHL